jgi:phenylacetate-CoA ligase
VFFSTTDILRGRETISRLKVLRRSQHWSRDRLLTRQLDRLNELLSQPATNSPFYGERLAAIRSPFRDLAEIELLTKDDVRQNLEGIRTRNVPSSRFIESRTGGSTGEPLTFLWDKRARDWNRASAYRSAEWAGVALGEKAVQTLSARVSGKRRFVVSEVSARHF